MNTYTYTIFDGDPNTSGPCSWPTHENIQTRGRSPESVARRVLEEARKEARACGEYGTGDALWVTIWQDDQVVLTQRTVL